jgi:hypothetical protein
MRGVCPHVDCGGAAVSQSMHFPTVHDLIISPAINCTPVCFHYFMFIIKMTAYINGISYKRWQYIKSAGMTAKYSSS